LSSASWTIAGRRDWERSSIPMTVRVSACYHDMVDRHTVVNRLELRDDVETDIRELVLEHLQEHGEEM
jgi:hypothetical protein